jgi:hypothetical protein
MSEWNSSKHDKFSKEKIYDSNHRPEKIDKFSAFKLKVNENLKDEKVYITNSNIKSHSPLSNKFNHKSRNDSKSKTRNYKNSKDRERDRDRKIRENEYNSRDRASKNYKRSDTVSRDRRYNRDRFAKEDHRGSRTYKNRSSSRTRSRASRKYRKEDYSRRRRSRSYRSRSNRSRERESAKENYNTSLVSAFKRKSIFQDASEVQVSEIDKKLKNDPIKTVNENRVVSIVSNHLSKPSDKSDQKLYVGNIPIGIDILTVSIFIILTFYEINFS